MATSLETLSNDLATAVEAVGQSLVAVHARRRIPSTGVLWRPGLVVAADHTVRTDDEVTITLAGGAEARGHVTGRDPTTDLCILQLGTGPSASAARPATVADGTVRVGEVALVVGRPGVELRAALGIVSSTGPAWRTPSGGRIDQFIHLDVAVYDGFSGGPLVTAGGRVAGICTSGLARGAPIVVPSATVHRVVDALIKHGGVTRRGFLGIGTQLVPLPEGIRQQLPPVGGRVPATGLMVVSVQPGTSADRGGMLLGDVLVRLGDDVIEDPRDVLAALGPESVGRDLRATVIRAGQPVELTVTVAAHQSRN